MKTNLHYSLIFFTFLIFTYIGMCPAQDKSDWTDGFPEACTSITLGKLASADGSVITSHTDDSHRTRSWINIMPAKDHSGGSATPLLKRVADDQ